MRALVAALLLAAAPAGACTTFLLPGHHGVAVGKCYDWHMGQGLVLVNPRGLAKRAFALLPGDRPAAWTARYASVTFNQYGREMPNGGMNEAGLVVEILWLSSSRFSPPDARPTVNELQWIQHQLDRFATVAEVVEQAAALRVSRVHGQVHYFACDKGGACATLEHLDGKLVVTSGPARALTNHPYADSLAHLRRHAGFGGARPVPAGAGSLDRFVRAASLVAGEPRAGDLAAKAFDVIDRVTNDDSRWAIVYDLTHLRVHFRTRAVPREKWLDLARVAAPCGAPARMLDLDADRAGDVTDALVDYTEAANRRLLAESLRELAPKLPPGAVDRVAAYPSALACAAP